MTFLKPPRLKSGDTLAAITLSDAAAGMFPEVFETAKQNLEQLFGLKVIPTPHALKDDDWIYNHPELRADDLHWALENPEVKGIISMIGGYESVRTLPFINPDLIRKYPKVFMGYSDTTIQLITHLNAGVVSFQGPSMMAGISSLKGYPYAKESMQRILFEGYIGRLQPAPFWSETHLDWESPGYVAMAREPLGLQKGEGWLWLQGNSRAEGHLIGGCIEVLEMLKGTKWWLKPELFEGAVLYLETSNEVPSVSQVEYWLRNYASLGILNSIHALLFARARDYTAEMKDRLHKSILKVLKEAGRVDMPVVANMDIGHTSPMMVMANGCKMAVDAKNKTVEMLEAAVS
jgi:muramoyltetrapeptide carboxypeptidase LdcA involved in peptidoglycan recycling